MSMIIIIVMIRRMSIYVQREVKGRVRWPQGPERNDSYCPSDFILQLFIPIFPYFHISFPYFCIFSLLIFIFLFLIFVFSLVLFSYFPSCFFIYFFSLFSYSIRQSSSFYFSFLCSSPYFHIFFFLISICVFSLFSYFFSLFSYIFSLCSN